MKSLLIIASSTLALAGLAACGPGGKPAVRAALDCPEVQGELTRTAIAADRKSCTYRTAAGAEIGLQLVATNGDPATALKAIETRLMTVAQPAPGSTPVAEAADATAQAAEDAARDAAAVAREAEQDAARAAGDAERSISAKVDIHVDGDGKTVTTQKDGEVTRVQLPGINITAGEDDAKVKIGGLTVNADGDEATVHIVRDVRLKGEAFSRQKRGLRATFIHEGALADGYRFVGYEAAGPKAGPITVATVRAKTEIDDGSAVYKDVKRLVRRNGGV
ncbi:methyltransferase type 11 [Phenylobacterium sp.]|uniref:methyltransferase type 11 n=1 Tax=Phenylobacterium sp. TaxID=1871053 RepID=UPI002CFC2A0B|nr:methyltransferase type 11 [Phenylobacterium sp.]HVI33039.1 methyltransferase type 11 [Phenylobacterium sp.]